jgi:hypothetical protein
MVSIYARDSRGTALEPFPAIGQALGQSLNAAAELAGRRAGARLGARAWARERSAFEVNVPGEPGPVREGLPRLEGGVEGLVLVPAAGGQVYVPAGLYLADSPSAERYLSQAAAAADLRTEMPRMHRSFRATTFVQLAPGGEIRPVFRGNLLLAAPDAPTLRAAALAGGRWLAGAQRADGRFPYRYCPTERRTQDDQYNLARHCAAAWGLFLLHDRTGGQDRRLLEAANRALDWARALARKTAVPAVPELAVADAPGPTASGAALALLATVEAVRIGGRKDLKREAVAMGDAVLRCFQHEDGRFWSWWDPRTGRPAGDLSFIYHPGELLLALAGLHEVSGEKRFLEAALRGMDAQVKAEAAHYLERMELPPDAWTIQAVEALERVAPPRKEWREHAWLLADCLARGQYGSPTGPAPKAADYLGGMNNLDPPIACAAGARGEGLAAACRLARVAGQAERARRYRERLLEAARFSLEGQYRAENSYWLPEPERALGGVRQSLTDTTIRIDYVQHCCVAMLAAAEILEQDPGQ